MWASRLRGGWAVALSVGLHVALLLGLRGEPARAPRQAVASPLAPLEVELRAEVKAPPPAPSPTAGKPTTRPVPSRHRVDPRPRLEAPRPPPETLSVPAEAPGDAPRGIDLFPATFGSFALPEPTDPPRAGPPRFDVETQAQVARERVQAMAREGLGRARATGGLIDPAASRLGRAFEQALAHADGGTPVELGVTDANASRKEQYLEAASRFGRTGDPGLPPPGRQPTNSERLAALEAPDALRLGVQAAETSAALERSKPYLSTEVEVQWSGGDCELRLVRASGLAAFDAFVLREARQTLAHSPEAAPEHTARLVWLVEGWLHKRADAVETVVNALAPMTGGLPLMPFIEQVTHADPARADFEYRVKLLQWEVGE